MHLMSAHQKLSLVLADKNARALFSAINFEDQPEFYPKNKYPKNDKNNLIQKFGSLSSNKINLCSSRESMNLLLQVEQSIIH